MKRNFYLKFIFSMVLLFVLTQVFSLYFLPQYENFSVFGVGHLIFLFALATTFLVAEKANIKGVFFVIFIYQIVLVLGTYIFYLAYYENPLGYSPTDEIYYNDIGNLLKDYSLSGSIEYLVQRNDIGDFGFPLLLKMVYSLGGDPILNMKLINVAFHLLTCHFIFKLSNILLRDKRISTLIVLLYGLSTTTVYFNSLGRKEPFFVLVVTMCFYYCYRAFLSRKLSSYPLALLLIAATGLFRTVFPVFILLAFGLTMILMIEGKYKLVFRIFMLSAVAIGFMGLLFFVGDEISSAMAVDSSALVSYRLGRAPTSLDYITMVISGIIGPFPSFRYTEGNDAGLLQTVGNFYKLICSYFFLIGVIRILKERKKDFFPILVFIGLNIIMLVTVAATLDHRYLYPFMPVYFIIIAKGLVSVSQKKPKGIWNVRIYTIAVLVLIVGYNLR